MEEEYIGEIIESSTVHFTAETRELHKSPPFGAFVKTDSKPTIFGIVSNTSTHSIEPNRRPTAYGKSEEELRMEQPQIFELLKTEFESIIVGYHNDVEPKQYLPPQPPRIHNFVHYCSPGEVREFTSNWDFLRTILNASKNTPTDELIIAVVKNALAAHRGESEYLVRTGKELSRLIRDDYHRLSSIIRRIQD